MALTFPTTKTPEEARDVVVEWLKHEAEFIRASARLAGGKRAQAETIRQSELVMSLAESLKKYLTVEEQANNGRKA